MHTPVGSRLGRDVREFSMHATRPRVAVCVPGEVPVLGASIAASPFLPYGELPRARCWGRSVRRVPLARIRSAQTELLDVAVQVLGERSCVGTKIN